MGQVVKHAGEVEFKLSLENVVKEYNVYFIKLKFSYNFHVLEIAGILF